MLIKLAFGCVYTSPCCSATLSGVSFFLSNSQTTVKKHKAILLFKTPLCQEKKNKQQ